MLITEIFSPNGCSLTDFRLYFLLYAKGLEELSLVRGKFVVETARHSRPNRGRDHSRAG
jgi:hypothetical protein